MPELEFCTNIRPSKLLKSITSNSLDCSEFARALLMGKITVLFCQGFISLYTYNRYFALIEKAENGTLKLRQRNPK